MDLTLKTKFTIDQSMWLQDLLTHVGAAWAVKERKCRMMREMIEAYLETVRVMTDREKKDE
jgi:hypothetical protein